MKVQINITANSTAKNLKDRLQKEANRRGKSLSTYAGEVLSIALKDKKTYGTILKNSEDKGGKHISAKVTEPEKEALASWAKDEDTTLSRWCSHLLEKHLELNKN